MNSKVHVKVLSVLLSIAITFGLFSFASVKDVSAETITLTQAMIEGNDGALPSGGYFVLEKDLDVTKGVVLTNSLEIDLNGKTIYYKNTNLDEYLCESSSPLIKFLNGYIATGGAPIAHCTEDAVVNLIEVNISANNTAYTAGRKSAIFLENTSYASCYLNNSKISGFSGEKGGAIYASTYWSQIYIDGGSKIQNCYAVEGGAIYSVGRVALKDCEFATNTAENVGGAICISDYGTLVIDVNVNIHNNKCKTANGGAGVYINRNSDGGPNYNYDNGLILKGNENIYITGNSYINGEGSTPSNVYLGNGSRNIIEDNSGSYIDSVHLGISVSSDRTDPIFVDDDSYYGIGDFTSDDSDYFIEERDGSYYVTNKDQKSIIRLAGLGLFVRENYDEEGDLLLSCVFYVDTSVIDVKNLKASYVSDSFEGNAIKKTDISLREMDSVLSYYCFEVPVDPAFMTSDIEINLYDSTNNNSLLTESVTVKEYAMAIINKADKYSADDVKTAKALLNFGAAAQSYFGVNEEDLANSLLSDEDKKSVVPQEALDNYEPVTVSYADNSDVEYYGMSLVLKSQVTLKVYFKITGDGLTADDFLAAQKYHDAYEIHKTNNPKYFYVEFVPYYGYYGLDTGFGIYMSKYIYTETNEVAYSDYQLEMSFDPMQYILGSLTKYKGEDPKLDKLMEALYVLNSL